MKHTSPLEAAIETQVRVPTRRTLAKQQTRSKVLAAARRLFSQQGYEGATIRDIAAAAGMSTGAVFANFSDKSDLFREIMIADFEALAEAMRDAAGRGRAVEDALLRVFSAGYVFYRTQLPLARAAFSVSWAPEDGHVLRTVPPIRAMLAIFIEQLTDAVQRGELSQEADVKLRSQMLFDAYLSNYPRAIFEGWSLEALQARSRDQIRILLAGARRG
ncbi:TetR/AcrR family transcriptional regulator [Phenylobacterium sp.]|uniref:TetR/AcrR family transcriptional regulator n=1 Tax=Phenylobacterium sp. TaxID=1871053 RepID=UPI003983AD74